LFACSAEAGAICSGMDSEKSNLLREYGENIGMAFQITDDLLDITATAETIGKTPGKDLRSKKATYPAFYGVEATRKHLAHAHETACASLERLDQPTELLRAIADFILERQA